MYYSVAMMVSCCKLIGVMNQLSFLHILWEKLGNEWWKEEQFLQPEQNLICQDKIHGKSLTK